MTYEKSLEVECVDVFTLRVKESPIKHGEFYISDGDHIYYRGGMEFSVRAGYPAYFSGRRAAENALEAIHRTAERLARIATVRY